MIVIDSSLRPRPPLHSRDTDVTVRQNDGQISPLASPPVQQFASAPVAWGNQRWNELTQGKTIAECVDVISQNKLQTWVEGDIGEKSESFTLDMKLPEGVTLHLAKTILPLSPPSASQSFCILTSQYINKPESFTPSISSSDVLFSPLPRFSQTFSRSSSFSSNPRRSIDVPASLPGHRGSATSTSSNLRSSVDLTSPNSEYSPPSREQSTYFTHRFAVREERPSVRRRRSPPNSFKRSKPPESHAQDCWDLVENFDWSKTALGPREQWMDALDPVLAITFESRTADCAWLGPDLELV